jgi:hypothetical protein
VGVHHFEEGGAHQLPPPAVTAFGRPRHPASGQGVHVARWRAEGHRVIYRRSGSTGGGLRATETYIGSQGVHMAR